MKFETILAPAPEAAATHNDLWQDYQDAVAAYNSASADPSTPTSDKVRLALESTLAWRAFAVNFGLTPSTREAEQRINDLVDERNTLLEAISAAHSLLHAVFAGGLIEHLPADEDRYTDHRAGCSLISQAEGLLRHPLKVGIGQ